MNDDQDKKKEEITCLKMLFDVEGNFFLLKLRN